MKRCHTMERDEVPRNASFEDGLEESGEAKPLLRPQSDEDQPQTKMASEPKIIPQYITALCATLGALAMGAVLGYSSPAGSILTSNSTDSNIHLTSGQNSWFSSVVSVGALIGGPAGGFFANTFGRRGTMIYLIVPALSGWILIAAAQNFAMLLLGRLMTGLFIGATSLVVPTYIAEFASAHIRGMLGGGFQLMVVTGILYVYCMGAAFDSFQWIAALCAILPCLFSVSMIFNHESPGYLLSKGKRDEAEKALQYFRGKEYSGIQKEFDNMQESLEQASRRKVTFRDLKAPYILKPLLMSVGLMFFQQFSGINGVLFNLNSIFQATGSSMSATLSSIIVALVQVVATFGAAAVIDKAGRKVLLLLSSAAMALSLVALGAYFYLKDIESDLVDSLGWLPLSSLTVFIVGFSVGFGPIPWVMMSELFSPEVKELASGLATFTNWTCSFVVTLLFDPLQDLIYDYGVYWLFAGFCALSFIFVFVVVFETKGKTLQEINAHFGAPQTLPDDDTKP